MERLDFNENVPYSAVEASIHLSRYLMAKPFVKGAKILDAACGEGYGSCLLKKWGADEVIGIDIDEDAIKRAESVFGFSGVKFQRHNVETMPYPDCYFDVVISFETIEHLDNPDVFLQEVRRVLKPGGTIIISCPNDPYYYPNEDQANPFHKRKYTYFEFKELAEKYLGNSVEYFLAFAVNGFMNMPISRSTEPSDAKSPDMMEMMNYVECDNALCVKQERYVNHWNSNYYVGIWGGNEVRNRVNTVIFPRETFLEVKDENIELIKEIENWKKDKEKTFINYKQEVDVEKLKVQRQSLMIELLNKEIESLRRSYDGIHQKYEEYRNAAELIEQEKAYVDAELIGIKRSKGWKLLQVLYKIEGIFRK